MTEKIVEFMGIKSKVIKQRYWDNKRVCLQLVSTENNGKLEVYEGEPIATATTNIPEVSLESNEVIIKNISGNEGILEALAKAGIVKTTGKTVKIGLAEYPICELLEG